MFFKIILTSLLIFFSQLSCAKDIKEKILSDVRHFIIPKIIIPDSDLNKLSPEFKGYYLDNVKPDIDKLYGKTRVIYAPMKDSAGHSEVILIGDTARSNTIGLRNFLAIATKAKGVWKIATFKIIDDGSVICNDKNNCSFTYYDLTIRPPTPNHFIGASLTYAQYGASAHNFYTEIFGRNRFPESYYIHRISSPVPLVPAKK